MVALAFIVIGAIAVFLVLFMLGAARLASEADRQSEVIGDAIERASTSEDGGQDSAIGNAAGPRKVKPV